MPDSRIIFGSPSLQTGRMIWKGAWSSIVSYFVNDVVSNGGNSYIAIADSFNVAPTVTTSWNIMASGNAVTSVSGRVGAISLSSSDLTDKDAANGVAGLDASAFLKAAEFNTTINAQTGVTYAIAAGDRGKLVTFSNASPVAVSIAQATGSFAAGFFVEVENIGAGLVTITPATSTVEGAATVTLKQWESIVLTSAGGNYVCLRSKVRIATADLPGGSTGSGAVVLATSPTFVTSAITPALVLNGNTLNGVTGSGTAVVTNTSPTIASPTLTGTTAAASIVLNGASTGAGAALTVGGTSSTTGGISVFVGAAGSQNERLSVVPADGSGAAVRVGALSVRPLSAGFLTGTEAAGISTTGAITGLSLALGGGTALTTTNRTGTGNLVLATSPTVSDPTLTGVTLVKRIRATQGTAMVAGDFALSGGWGTTASVGSVLGTDSAFSFVVTSSGTGQGVGPTVTITFHDGTWTNSPLCVVNMGPGNSALAGWIISSVSATQLVLQGTLISANFTPVTGNTYGGTVICIGR